jgi:AraC family ethanolamine operon transcriptional activator
MSASTATPSVPGWQYVLETQDFDELALAFRGWDARFQQLGHGPFHGELHLVQAGAVQLIRVRANRVMWARGCMRPGFLFFTTITPHNTGATWRGRHLAGNQINVNQPGGEMNHLSTAPYETLSLGVDFLAFQAWAERSAGMDLAGRLRGFEVLTVSQKSAAALHGCCAGIMDRLLPTAKTGTVLADAAAVERICLTRLLEVLSTAKPFTNPQPRLVNRLRLVRHLEDFLQAHLKESLQAEDLCREADTSERTLRYAFQDVFGLSPMAFFKTLKLNAARQALKAATPATTTVYQIATAWGFEHTGNFAADYLRLFGELPSQTLAGRRAVH